MNEYRPGQEHPDPEDLAAYLDGRVSDRDGERIEAHAAECPECRREIADVTGTLARLGAARRWRVWAPAAAAAAVLAVLLLGAPRIDDGSDGAVRFRGPDPAAEPAEILISSPPTDGTVGRDGLAFVWRSTGPDASYQLTLTDGEGAVVWEMETTDTVVSLPDTIDLEPGSAYHWYVDALLRSGWSTTSGVHSFTTRH